MTKTALLTEVLTAEVAVPLPITGLFSYTVPEPLRDKVKTGVRVLVPFRNREIIGYLIDAVREKSDLKLKPLTDVLDAAPVISPAMLELTQWISRYYGTSWGEAIENALPKWIKYGKKAARALEKAAQTAGGAPLPKKADLTLSRDQARAFEVIGRALEEEKPKPILLYGVTGSGKSELYIRTIRAVLERGQSSICLVPEIALTEQIRRFFHHHFGHELEILHSRLSDGERFLAWKRLESGERKVVLGPRSAVFAPLPDLGLIIMDEEHEGSYKQETTPRYHAREVAAWRAHHEGALFMMGSATPSLETMYRASQGAVRRLDLMSRIDEKALPEVRLVDLRRAALERRKSRILTPNLVTEIEKNLERGEGTMLLLNRRGFSTNIQCPKCGTVQTCTLCQVSLTFHQEDDSLLCHYCNSRRDVPDSCDVCGMSMLRFAGFGTEKVESEVAARFPAARIARMDTDSIRKKGSHETILQAFRRREIDILIGTQMIAKGFDFPHVTLVGVILADVGLMLPDFRSAERTFQLLTQVAGRAGRGKLPGRVLIQTFSPEHPSIRFAKDHDYLSFYRHEMEQRTEYRYPPRVQLINIIVRSRDEKKAYTFARAVRDRLREKMGPEGGDLAAGLRPPVQVEIIGPAPLPFYKLRGHYRWHIMIKTPAGLPVVTKVTESLAEIRKPSAVAYALDIDPLNIL